MAVSNFALQGLLAWVRFSALKDPLFDMDATGCTSVLCLFNNWQRIVQPPYTTFSGFFDLYFHTKASALNSMDLKERHVFALARWVPPSAYPADIDARIGLSLGLTVFFPPSSRQCSSLKPAQRCIERFSAVFSIRIQFWGWCKLIRTFLSSSFRPMSSRLPLPVSLSLAYPANLRRR